MPMKFTKETYLRRAVSVALDEIDLSHSCAALGPLRFGFASANRTSIPNTSLIKWQGRTIRHAYYYQAQLGFPLRVPPS